MKTQHLKTKSKTFQVPGSLVRANPMKDGGMSLGFYTQDLSSKEKVQLMDFLHSFGWLLFKENEFSDSDIPKDDASDDTKKPSQRLRSVIFIYWKQQGSKGDFDQFYNQKMEFIISQFKERLEPDIK